MRINKTLMTVAVLVVGALMYVIRVEAKVAVATVSERLAKAETVLPLIQEDVKAIREDVRVIRDAVQKDRR